MKQGRHIAPVFLGSSSAIAGRIADPRTMAVA